MSDPREERIAAQFSRDFHARGDHQYSGAEIYQWLKRQEGEHIAGNEGIAACMRLNAKLRDERDEALRVRDLAREASNRDLELKRASEAENARLRDLVRYARHQLFEEGLLTPEDYAAIVQERGAVERLETYDSMRATLRALEAKHRQACQDRDLAIQYLWRIVAAFQGQYAALGESSKLLAVCGAAETLLKIIEADDVPGYIYNEQSAECVVCEKIAATMAAVQHEPGCFQGAIERVRDALGDLETA